MSLRFFLNYSRQTDIYKPKNNPLLGLSELLLNPFSFTDATEHNNKYALTQSLNPKDPLNASVPLGSSTPLTVLMLCFGSTRGSC